MRLRTAIKQNARRALEGNWARGICIVMISFSIYLVFCLLQGLVSLLLELPGFQDVAATPGLYWDDLPGLSPAALGLELVFAALSLLINAPLILGIRHWFYALAGGEREELAALFTYFSGPRLFLRSLWCRVNLAVRLALWAVPFAVLPAAVCLAAARSYAVQPSFGSVLLMTFGVLLALLALVFFLIFANRYFLVPYLVSDQPELSVGHAARLSVRTMKGNRCEVFLLSLSFLPWLLFSILLLPLLYFVPYRAASRALYAKYYIERARLIPTDAPAPKTAPPDADSAAHGEEPLAD